MSDQSEVISLPSYFVGAAMSQLAGSVVRKKTSATVWPKRITFDFQTLRFIGPTGIVFLHNIIRWLQAKDCIVSFRNHNHNTAAIRYLHDSLFFKIYLEEGLIPANGNRATTSPLVEIKQKNSHSWIRLTLIPLGCHRV
jgi:hypothetical protein